MRLLPLLFALLLPLAATANEVRLTNGEWSPYLGQNLPELPRPFGIPRVMS